VLALGVMGCGETSGDPGGSGGSAGMGGAGGDGGTGGSEACADWAGDWSLSSVSCDGVVEPGLGSGVDLRFAANCTGETVLMNSATCDEIIQMTFTPGAGDTTSIDHGAITCSGECASHECEAIADAAQPYAATITVSDNAWTSTALTTAQMVSDGFTPCEVGQTMVTTGVPK
jgi:hypothetical protein